MRIITLTTQLAYIKTKRCIYTKSIKFLNLGSYNGALSVSK